MIRKMLTSFLCLLLALMMPMASLAEPMQYALTITPGAELVPHLEGVETLLEALTLTFLGDAENTCGAIQLSLDGAAVLSIAARPDSTGLFVHTDAVNDSAMFVTWEDALTFIEDSMPRSYGMSLAFVEIKKLLNAVRTETMDVLTVDLLKRLSLQAKAIRQTISGDAALKEILARMYQDEPVAQGLDTESYRDAANTVITLNITTEDCLALVETETFNALITAMLSEYFTGTALEKSTFFIISDIKALLKTLLIDVKVKLLAADQLVVQMDISSSISDIYGSVVELDGNYYRYTAADGIDHRGTFDMRTGGYIYIPDIQMAFDIKDAGNDGLDGVCYGVCDGTQLSVRFGKAHKADEKNYALDIYVRDRVTVLSALYDFETPVLSLDLAGKAGETAVFDTVRKATGQNSVQVLRLSASALEEFTEELVVNAVHTALVAASYLPNDILGLIIKEVMRQNPYLFY